MQIKDVIAVITGGASGLGEATARSLTCLGAKVAILDIAVERGEKIAAELGRGPCSSGVPGRARRLLYETSNVQFPTLSFCGGSSAPIRRADIVPSPWCAEIKGANCRITS